MEKLTPLCLAKVASAAGGPPSLHKFWAALAEWLAGCGMGGVEVVEAVGFVKDPVREFVRSGPPGDFYVWVRDGKYVGHSGCEKHLSLETGERFDRPMSPPLEVRSLNLGVLLSRHGHRPGKEDAA